MALNVLALLINLNAEITTNSAASPLWYHGSTQPIDLTQYNNAVGVQSCDSQVVWPLRKNDISSGKYYGNMVQSEGTWSPSPPLNVSLNLFQDTREDEKPISGHSYLNDFTSPISSRPTNGSINDQVEKGTKAEASGCCRLFGINLKSHCSAAPLSEKETCSRAKESALSVAYEADRAQNPDVSKLSMERKQVISEIIPNDMQGKLGSVFSTRTRTKVRSSFCWSFKFILPSLEANIF